MRKMIGLVICLAAAGSGAGFAASGIDWSRAGALEGAELTATEWTAVTHRGATFRCTQLRLSGAPEGLRYRLWQRWLDGAEHPPGSTIEAGADGILLETVDGSQFLVCLGQFFPGEPLEALLVSEDRGTRVFGTLIPFPLESTSRDGGCRLALRLVNSEGTVFFAQGTGFAPGERLETESRSGKDRRVQAAAATPEGTFAAYLQPEVGGKKGGSATFSVTGAECSVTIEYDWGRSMRRR